jgi:hypothetical protein
MKRFLAFGLSIIFVLIGLPAKSNASLEGCPNSWNIQSPNLVINKYSALSNNAKIYFYTSSLYGPENGVESTGKRYSLDTVDPANRNLRRFNGESALKIILPEVFEKLTSLGRDAVWSSKYELVNPEIKSVEAHQNEFNALFSAPVRPWLLYYLGIGNGTQIKWNLKISVKSCPDFSISSNVYKFDNIEMSSISFDEYLKSSTNDSASIYNFKQEELIKSRLESNKKLLSQGVLKNNIQLNRIGFAELDGKEFAYLLLGTNPAGCIESINPRSLPAVNPIYASVKSQSCQISVVANFNLTEQSKCKSNTCLIDQNYQTLISGLERFNGSYWQGDFVEVDTFKITLSKGPNTTNKSIKCIKGKLIKKVTGTSPKCPTGYKLA